MNKFIASIPVLFLFVSFSEARQSMNFNRPHTQMPIPSGGSGPAPGTVILGVSTGSITSSVLVNPGELLGTSPNQSNWNYAALYSAVPATGEFYIYAVFDENMSFEVYDSTKGLVCGSSSKAVTSGGPKFESFTLNNCPSLIQGNQYTMNLVGDNYNYRYIYDGPTPGAWATQAGVTVGSPPNPLAPTGAGTEYSPQFCNLKN